MEERERGRETATELEEVAWFESAAQRRWDHARENECKTSPEDLRVQSGMAGLPAHSDPPGIYISTSLAERPGQGRSHQWRHKQK